MALLALVGFWVGVVFLWVEDGAKVPIIFIVFWLIGFFGLPMMDLGRFFWPYEAILAILVIITWKVKSAL